MRTCDYWWGTHACDLPDGHTGFHTCIEGPSRGICSEFDGLRVRFAGEDKWRPTGGGRVRDILPASFTETFNG